MRAIYIRLNAVRDIFKWDFEEAVQWLCETEEAGHLTGVGVFDEDTNTLYAPDDRELFAIGDGVTDYWTALRALGIVVKKVAFYSVKTVVSGTISENFSHQ